MWAIIAMLAVILATDQLVWRPLLAWADNFKIELTESAAPPSSWVYNLLRRSYIFPWFDKTVWQPFSDWLRTSRIVFRHVNLRLRQRSASRSRRLRGAEQRLSLPSGSAGRPFAA